MFPRSSISAGARKRRSSSFDINYHQSERFEILRELESYIDTFTYGVLSGHDCVLRALCEASMVRIYLTHSWLLVMESGLTGLPKCYLIH